MIDLRSDTVTRPSDAMRTAMMGAAVGDDVFGEDPTVIELQKEVARLLGKEAALFVPSGVMGNQLAVRAHTSPGDEVILEEGCHIANHETGAAGALSGVQLRTVEGDRGVMSPADILRVIRHGYYWEPNPRLICIENTHNQAGGAICPLDNMEQIAAIARERGLAMHLDGARLWNASVASGIPESQFAAHFDSVSVCLSKGLGAPVGSVLAGDAEFIDRAHRFRKMFGGGMRQVGILAAAGLHALRHHRTELSHDHDKARRLAEGLSNISSFSLDPALVETNIVMFDLADGSDALVALEKMKSAGVLMVPFGPSTIRATTHRDIRPGEIDDVLGILSELF